MQDSIFQALPFFTVSLIRRLYVDKRLLIEVMTLELAGRLGANIF